MSMTSVWGTLHLLSPPATFNQQRIHWPFISYKPSLWPWVTSLALAPLTFLILKSTPKYLIIDHTLLFHVSGFTFRKHHHYNLIFIIVSTIGPWTKQLFKRKQILLIGLVWATNHIGGEFWSVIFHFKRFSLLISSLPRAIFHCCLTPISDLRTFWCYVPSPKLIGIKCHPSENSI